MPPTLLNGNMTLRDFRAAEIAENSTVAYVHQLSNRQTGFAEVTHLSGLQLPHANCNLVFPNTQKVIASRAHTARQTSFDTFSILFHELTIRKINFASTVHQYTFLCALKHGETVPNCKIRHHEW